MFVLIIFLDKINVDLFVNCNGGVFYLFKSFLVFKIIFFLVDGMWVDWGFWGICFIICGGGN